MTSSQLLCIDYAWAHPNISQIVANGYKAVIRYVSHDVSKSLTAPEIAQLHAAGLGIGVVFEDAASRALAGRAAGVADGQFANAYLDQIGYPRWKPVGVAVDFGVTAAQLPTVLAYIEGFASTGRTAYGYGSSLLVDALTAAGIPDDWQTCAWSQGVVNDKAALYQRLRPTTKLTGSFDEDVILHPSNDLWYPGEQPPPASASTKPPAQPVAIATSTGDDDMAPVILIRNLDSGAEYLANLTTMPPTLQHLSDPRTVTGYQAAGIPLAQVGSGDIAHYPGYAG